MRSLAALLFVVLLLHMSSCTAPGQALDPDMILAVDSRSGRGPAGAQEPWVIRHAFVDLNRRALDSGEHSVGDTLRARLFDDEVVRLQLVSVDSVASRLSVRADLVAPESGFLLLTLAPDRAAGTLEWASRAMTLHIRHDEGSGRHLLLHVDPEAEDVLPGAPPEIPPAP
jgi:hypothetical protein